jgi:uncharacterized protein YsxB (DUF464 family)
LIKLENPTLSGEIKKEVYLQMKFDEEFNELTIKPIEKNKEDKFQSLIEDFKENLETLMNQSYSKILLSLYQVNH